MSARFCGECGKPLREQSKFCASCGWKVIDAPQPEQNKEQEQPVQPVGVQVEEERMEQQVSNQSAKQNQSYQQPFANGNNQAYGNSTANNQNYSAPGPAQPYNQNYNTAGPSQSYSRNYGPGPGASAPNNGYGAQNQFKQFSGQFGNESYNAKSKKAGYGLGVVVLMVIIAIAAFVGIKLIKGGDLNLNIGNPLKDMPAIGKNANVSPADLNGVWISEFTATEVKVNGESDPAYAGVVGKTTDSQMALDIQPDGKGTATFQGQSYGYDFNNAVNVEYKNGKIQVMYSDPNQGVTLKYSGDVKKDGEDFLIDGKFETSYKVQGSEDEMKMKGSWTASMSKGKVAKGADTSNAKKDVTIDQLAGTWTGKMVYADVKNLDKIPDATEEDKEMFRKLIGMEVDCSILFEESNIVFTITDPTGGTSDLDELPPISLKDGVFTGAMKIDDRDGQGKMNVYGVVTEQDGQLKITGDLTISMEVKEGAVIEFNITYSVTK